MLNTFLGLAALVFLAFAAVKIRERIGVPADAQRYPKGWLGPDATLAQALDVAGRHLPAGRTGATVRLQYGRKGVLTLMRTKPGSDPARYVARWEFWTRNTALAERLIAARAATVHRPGPQVLELVFGDDYLSFRTAIETALGDSDIVAGNMHLTWNC